jgi:predicted dehydrogenase
MAALRVGLIGCGRVVQLVHLNVLTRLPDVDLVALAEPDPQRREEAHRRVPTAVAVADYDGLLDRADVDAVVICTPSALHAEIALAALERGKHVYIEKPLATSVADGQRVLAAWQRAGVVGMVGFNYRFNRLHQRVRAHLQAGRLGELVAARSVFATPLRPLPDWKQRRESGGGVLFDLASHHVDLVRFLLGSEVREVYARVWSQLSEGDNAMLELRLDSGLVVQSFFSLIAVDEDRFEIYGQAGKLAVDRYLSLDAELTDPTRSRARARWVWGGLQRLIPSPHALQKVMAPGNEPSYRAALAHFVVAARHNQPASPDLADGFRSLAVLEAAEESARMGRPVAVANLFTDQLLADVGAEMAKGVR